MKLQAAWREDALGTWRQAEQEGRQLTVRILDEARAKEEAPRLLFEEEMRRVTSLRHTHVLRVVTQGNHGLRTWYATEDARSRTLADHVAEGPLPDTERDALLDGLIAALAYLDKRKQVHVALNPERILRHEHGWVLSTFRDIRARDELRTLRKRAPAAPRYAPPERFPGHADTPKAPGVMAYQVGGLLRAAIGAGAPTREDGTCAPIPPEVDVRWRDPLVRLLHPTASLRPQGLAAIERALAGEGGPGGKPGPKRTLPPAPVPTRRRGRRGRRG